MENGIFQRREVKYLLDSRQRAIVEQAFRKHMLPDPHGESTICNVYYDTPDYLLIRLSLDKPVYKEKLRMRSYGRVGPGDGVFLELKKKYEDVVYKRRIELTQRQAERCMEAGLVLPGNSQIGREIEYFRSYYRDLRPAAYICYDRSAWYGRDDEQLRATFDQNICWRQEDMRLTAAPGGRHLLLPRQSLFEIKTAAAIPMWLVEALDAGQIRQASFSKYGEAYKHILKERSGVSCA